MPGPSIKKETRTTRKQQNREAQSAAFDDSLPASLRGSVGAARKAAADSGASLENQRELIVALQAEVLERLVGGPTTGKRKRGRPRKGEEKRKPPGLAEYQGALGVALEASRELRHLHKIAIDTHTDESAPRFGLYRWATPVRIQRDEEGRARVVGKAEHPPARKLEPEPEGGTS